MFVNDACGSMDLSTIQKIASGICQPAYGSSAYSSDDSVQIGKTIFMVTLSQFSFDIPSIYTSEFHPPWRKRSIGCHHGLVQEKR